MKSEEFWKNQKKELANAIEERRLLSKKIHLLQTAIKQHEEKPYKNPRAGMASKCFLRFGKRYKDLTKDERRVWAKERKRESQKRKKTCK